MSAQSVPRSPAFGVLHAAYHDRLGLLGPRGRSHQAGRCVVGVVGNTVPPELIHASGASALRIAPIDGDTRAADAHVESFSDRDARLVFARFVEGAYDALALLVIPRSSETWHKLYLALREAVRIGLKTDGPPLWLHDVPHTQRESSRRYGLARTQDLAQRLGELSGRAANADSLRTAIGQANLTRQLLQQLQARRLQGGVTGWQAQVATGGLRFLEPSPGQAALRAWLQEAAPSRPPRPRLFVQGVPLDHAELHGLVDDAGGCVVQEDDDWGSRAAAPLIDESAEPFGALFEHYWRDVPCLRVHPAPGRPWAFESAWSQGHIDAVLFNLPRPDDVHGWRFPAQRAAADAAGLPWLLVRDDARDTATRPALQQALRAFVQRLLPA